jgi:hypothetical protein
MSLREAKHSFLLLILILVVPLQAICDESKPFVLDDGYLFSNRDKRFYNAIFEITCDYIKQQNKKQAFEPDPKSLLEAIAQINSSIHKDYKVVRIRDELSPILLAIRNEFLEIRMRNGFGGGLLVHFVYSPPWLLKPEFMSVQISFDNKCKPGLAELFSFNEQKRPTRIITLARSVELGDGNKFEIPAKVQDILPAALPLNVIYANRKTPKMAARTIPVAFLDSGVDYNHPDLAFRIPRTCADDPVAKELSKSLELLVEKNDEIQKKLVAQKENPSDDRDYAAIQKRILEMRYRFSDLCETRVVGLRLSYQDHLPFDVQDEDLFSKNKEPRFHGTHVAGIVCKDTDFIQLVPLRFNRDQVPFLENWTDEDRENYKKKVTKLFDYVAEQKVRVVNISMDFDREYGAAMVKKFIRAHPQITFVFAAGNSGRELRLDREKIVREFQENFSEEDNVIFVAAVDKNNELAQFSNYGKQVVHLAALGVKVNSCWPGCRYKECSGTSMAAPQVTRTVAKMLYLNGNLSPRDISEILCRTATPVGPLAEKIKCGGVLNEDGAIEMVRKQFSAQLNPKTPQLETHK